MITLITSSNVDHAMDMFQAYLDGVKNFVVNNVASGTVNDFVTETALKIMEAQAELDDMKKNRK